MTSVYELVGRHDRWSSSMMMGVSQPDGHELTLGPANSHLLLG